MSISSNTHFRSAKHAFCGRSTDFNARMAEGIRRAPEERAKAVREFWRWLIART